MHHPGFQLLPLIVIGIMMALRFSRMRGARPLRLEHLWIVPAILLAGTVFVFVRTPPSGRDWLWIGLALLVGGAVGWWRGKMMRITIDPATHTLNQAASPAAIVFLLGLVVLRFAARSYMAGAGSHGLAATVTDALMAFALATFTLQRTEMFLRARRLLANARAAGPWDAFSRPR